VLLRVISLTCQLPSFSRDNRDPFRACLSSSVTSQKDLVLCSLPESVLRLSYIFEMRQ
jgi:hypothetical protein